MQTEHHNYLQLIPGEMLFGVSKQSLVGAESVGEQ